jgi:hypothetical protein
MVEISAKIRLSLAEGHCGKIGKIFKNNLFLIEILF